MSFKVDDVIQNISDASDKRKVLEVTPLEYRFQYLWGGKIIARYGRSHIDKRFILANASKTINKDGVRLEDQIIKACVDKSLFGEGYITLSPEAPWIPQTDHVEPKKCTCGISAIGGGKHSSWCDIKGD